MELSHIILARATETATETATATASTAAATSTSKVDAIIPDTVFGIIPLPWFIVMCAFGPFFISLTVFVVYNCTVGKYKHKKALERQEVEAKQAQEDVERQVRGLVNRPRT